MGKALSHAGVAVTITSVTDIFAFAVGSITILPGLRSFCLYASVGLLAIYLFQVSITMNFIKHKV
jgi:Niemann-Pick C1 protein